MFKNRVRLPFYLSKPQFPVEKNVFRKADGSAKLLSAIVRNTYEGITDQLPEDWHRKLTIALTHDEVTIEDSRLLTDVVLDGEYEINWEDFLNKPIAGAGFKIQVTPFNASNTNCQTCEEIAQVSLIDDYTDEIWDEGTTHEFPDLITANDSICCFPFEIELMSFNTDYFDSVTISEDGVLTATVKASVPDVDNVLIATYRVTCENGGYDEANVYGNIQGTSTECPAPTGLLVVLTPTDGTIASLLWDVPPSPAGGFDYELFLASDPVTPIQSGNTSADHVDLTGLTSGESYIFSLVAVCGAYDESTPVTTTFDTASRPADACGSFIVTYLPDVSEGIQSFSYMDCLGDIQNYVFVGAGNVTKCMLITPGAETPIFFAASTADITLNYLELC